MSSTTDLNAAPSVRCSFCNKADDQVKKVIAGPGVYVCNECVELCNEILTAPVSTEEAARQREDYEVRSRSTEGTIARLQSLAARAETLEAEVRGCVSRLKMAGVSWDRIGAPLGLTGEETQARFEGGVPG